MSRKLVGLGDLNKDKDKDAKAAADGNKAGKPGQNYYAGSGINVIGPGGEGGADGASAVDRIMKQQGVQGATRASASISIKWYKNGFTVDDGELRSYSDPANKPFLDSIEKGELPKELQQRVSTKAGAAEADVSVEDHRSEDYKPSVNGPPAAPAYTAYAGAGATLGAKPVAPSSAVVGGGKATPASVIVDESQATTTIQVKLASGKREKVVLNLTHTVADLQAKVASFGATGGRPFSLSGGYPPKPLADGTMTIEAAGLKNAAVTQVVA